MTKENYKPIAKCQFYSICSIYGASILNAEFEKELCGTGQQLDEKYVPLIPQHPNIIPVKDWELWPEGKCPAFSGYVLDDLTSDLEELLCDAGMILQGKRPIGDHKIT